MTTIVNTIGTPGTIGFGVGVCPGPLPTGMSPMDGADYTEREHYGNYQCADGSVMVWIPAYFYKIGTGQNGLRLDRVDVKPRSAFARVSEAHAAGYALHRAFYDGGEQPGFFIDKYLCSDNAGVASSLKDGRPLSTYKTHNPISALHGAPANAYHGVIAAAKTRGDAFFAASQFQRGALALLAHAHAQASDDTDACAWYTEDEDIPCAPRGCNNSDHGDVHDLEVQYEPEGHGNCGLTGSGTPFARTTHNGQMCGVADLNGLMWEVSPGMTGDTEHGRCFVLVESVRMKDMTGGAGDGPRDLWGTAEQLRRAGYDLMAPTARPVLSGDTEGMGWVNTALGIPDGNTERYWINAFGNRASQSADVGVKSMCPVAGGGWYTGASAGVWALLLSVVRGDSCRYVGFRAALYLWQAPSESDGASGARSA